MVLIHDPMSDNEKAELYRRIMERTHDETLVERMRALGFWPADAGIPQDAPEEAKERAEIEQELRKLREEYIIAHDPEQALNQERRRRWEESKRRRAERKKERQAAHERRLREWRAHRATHLVHAGEGVSGGLQDIEPDVKKLRDAELIILRDSGELAEAMGIPLSRLRWLTYHRRGATVVHYHRYSIRKKTGGARHISAPKPALKQAQAWVLQRILGKIPASEHAHGFLKDRSILTNAEPHLRQPIVINMDVKDFFPSITFRRVKGMLRGVGYGEHVATVLALLCTEPPRMATELDGKVYHVALGDRVLPQGACTSPAITNILCRRTDHRLAGLAKKHGFHYTRYADDLTFSGENDKAVPKLLRSVRGILDEEGFTEHPTKTRVMRKGNRREVTGVVVNDKRSVSRKEVRRLRAILHNAAKHGLESQNREDHPRFEEHLRGRVEHVCHVAPQHAAMLRRLLAEVVRGSE